MRVAGWMCSYVIFAVLAVPILCYEFLIINVPILCSNIKKIIKKKVQELPGYLVEWWYSHWVGHDEVSDSESDVSSDSSDFGWTIQPVPFSAPINDDLLMYDDEFVMVLMLESFHITSLSGTDKQYLHFECEH